MILTVLFYALIGVGILLTFAGATVAPRIFWLAGIVFYVASYIAVFSVGPFLLAVPIVLWTLALAGLFRLLRKPIYYAIAGAVGLAAWVIVFFTMKEWIFYPFAWLTDNAYDLLRQAMDQGE